jgi:hypothetical protein
LVHIKETAITYESLQISKNKLSLNMNQNLGRIPLMPQQPYRQVVIYAARLNVVQLDVMFDVRTRCLKKIEDAFSVEELKKIIEDNEIPCEEYSKVINMINGNLLRRILLPFS